VGGKQGCCHRAITGFPYLGSVGRDLAYGVLVDFERVHIMDEDDRPMEFVCPSPRDAFDMDI
jgi:hypothetical protein